MTQLTHRLLHWCFERRDPYQEVGEILHPVHNVLHGFQRRQVDTDLQGQKLTQSHLPSLHLQQKTHVITILTCHSHQSQACLVLWIHARLSGGWRQQERREWRLDWCWTLWAGRAERWHCLFKDVKLHNTDTFQLNRWQLVGDLSSRVVLLHTWPEQAC